MRLSANVQTLKPSATIAVSTLAKKLAAEGRDIINLSAGEPDFDTPSFISEQAVEGIRAGRTRYTPPAGIPELRVAIARRLGERGPSEASPEGVVVTAGAKQALFNAIFTLFGPGDEVLVAAPYWTTYPALVEIARAEPVAVFGDEGRGFKVSADDLEARASGSTRGLILNSPSNPTGSVYTLDELREIAAWCRDRGVWLVSDEIYRDIHHDHAEPAPGILSLREGERGSTVLVDGASKGFAMTGWRIGFSYTEPDLARKLAALQSQITSNAATPSQMAALAAYSDVESARREHERMGEAFRRRKDLVCRRMRELLSDVPFIEPGGAFYLYFRVDGLFDAEVDSGTAWCSRLLTEQGVALVPGAAFGDDRWVRLSFASSDEVLEQAMRRIVSMVEAVPAG